MSSRNTGQAQVMWVAHEGARARMEQGEGLGWGPGIWTLRPELLDLGGAGSGEGPSKASGSSVSLPSAPLPPLFGWGGGWLSLDLTESVQCHCHIVFSRQ